MKLRKTMTIIAALAVVTWLVIPAIRIWRDPALRTHRHTIGSPEGRGPVTIKIGGKNPTTISANSIVIDHPSALWKLYSATLLGRPSPHGDACPEWQSIRREILSPDPEKSVDQTSPTIPRRISGRGNIKIKTD